MNELVGFAGEPVLMRNSLILTGLTLRTFSAIAATDCFPSLVQEALPTRSPLKAAGPEVNLNVALTLAPGAIGSANEVAPEATAVQPFGAEMLNLTPVAGAPTVFVNVTVLFCEDPGENVCSPGGWAVADAGARLSCCAPYLAATMLTSTTWSYASARNVPPNI